MKILFFVCSTLAVGASLLVVFSANPVHSVLSLILVFCFTSVLLLLLNVDFLAILFIVVYVGAIAVLFLFVIMMLNIKVVQLSESTIRWVPVGMLIAISLFSQFYYLLGTQFQTFFVVEQDLPWIELVFGADTLEFLGYVLYSFFYLPFLLSGLVLLIALVGAITLTVGYRRDTRRQLVYKQVGRDLFGAVRFYR